MSSWWKKATKSITKVANDAGKAITDTTNKVVNTVTDTTNQVINTITDTTKDAESWVNKNIIKPINNEVIKPTEAQVKETTQDFVQEATKIGMTIDKGFNDGLDACEKVALEGTQAVVDSAIAIGDYIEENVCNIFVGGAIAGALAGMNTNPQVQTQNASMVAAAAAYQVAKGAAETAVIKTVSSALAVLVIEPLWTIPDVKKAFKGDKGCATDTLAAVIFFFACYMPGTVIATGGTVFWGIIGWIATSLICTGNLPKQILDIAKQA